MANFKVDTRLASLLGENYRSTEYALRELVDNAWDADASSVEITLPKPFNSAENPIIIKDNGIGMTPQEVENEYLKVARDRISHKGKNTLKRNRFVKGRKGIGKFAGLVVANVMILETKSQGKYTKLIINRDELKAFSDLETVSLPIQTLDCDLNEQGTEITLYQLNQNFGFPDEEKLKQILFIEYSRANDFKIFVNGNVTDIEDLTGEVTEGEITLKNAGKIRYRFTLTDGKKPLKYSGLAIRVQGKVVGKPNYFGLEDVEEIPQKLLKRIFGELVADGLSDDVTADWGAIIENSVAFDEIQKFIRPILEKVVKNKFKDEVKMQRARLQKILNKRLSKLPEHKRKFAERALENILKKFYNEKIERIASIVSVVLDSLEKDEYWAVLKHIEEAKITDIYQFAEALADFGFVDMIMLAKQAQNRLKFLDHLDDLINDVATDEMTIHKAIERNLWILGNEFSLLASNKTLKRTIKDILDKQYVGNRATKRPDLLLTQSIQSNYVIIEFKRPSIEITREHEYQAVQYRDDLGQYFKDKKIEIWIVGGTISSSIASNPERYEREKIKLLTFVEIVSNARTQLEWLIQELQDE